MGRMVYYDEDAGFVPYSDEPKSKKFTNADKIRAMTDEELAELLVKLKYPYRGDGKDYEVALNWLQSLVDEEGE